MLVEKMKKDNPAVHELPNPSQNQTNHDKSTDFRVGPIKIRKTISSHLEMFSGSRSAKANP